MSGPELDPLQHPEVQQASMLGYGGGFVATLVLLGAALVLTHEHLMPPVPLLGSIAGIAVVALLCQTFLSFGLDITQHNIWKSISLVLTIPLFILTIGLTVWMFQQLSPIMDMGAHVMPGMTMQPTMLQ